MHPPLPLDYRRESVRGEITYSLPVRPLGRLRMIALFLIPASMLVFIGPATAISGALRETGDDAGFNWLMAVFLVPFLLGSLVPIGLVILMVFGRCRVEWRDGRLSATEYAGPVRWRRRLGQGSLRKLTVNFGVTNNNKPVTTGPLADLAMLVAEFDRGKPRVVTLGYPRDWLHTLATDLSTRIGAAAPGGSTAAPAVELINTAEPGLEPARDIARPANTAVNIEPRGDGLTMVIPPAGLWKGSKGLFGFGIVWCLFMAAFTSFFIVAAFSDNDLPWLVWIFIGVFWMIGIALLVTSVNMGRKRALVAVVRGELKIAQVNLFGTRRWEWRREDLQAIRADASGIEVNHRPILELQIHPRQGKKTGLFAGRDPEELQWIAFELRRALGLEDR